MVKYPDAIAIFCKNLPKSDALQKYRSEIAAKLEDGEEGMLLL